MKQVDKEPQQTQSDQEEQQQTAPIRLSHLSCDCLCDGLTLAAAALKRHWAAACREEIEVQGNPDVLHKALVLSTE